MVVAGGGIRASGARNELIGLADAVGLPVVTAFRRTDAFPNDHPGYVGALGLSTLDNVRDAVLGADLVVAVGTRLSEVSTMRYAFPRAGQRVVHIDIDDQAPAAGWLTDYWRITADARLALGTLRRACVRLGVRGPAAWWTSHPAASAIRARAGGPDPFARLTAQVAARLDAVLPDDAVVTSDAGDFFIACAALIEFRHARRYLGPTSGTMGYGLPAALAAKLATPQRSCVALCGDGGALMSIQELETAVRYQIPVIQVVFNNHAYGSIVRHQKTRYGGRSVGSRLGDLDFARLAEGLGADGYRARSVPEFDEAFGAAVKSGRPSLVEVRL
jgi:acetolactate synthase-1/2/3 large subunit